MLWAILICCALLILLMTAQLIWTNNLDLRLGQIGKKLGLMDLEPIATKLQTLYQFARNSDRVTNELRSQVVKLENVVRAMELEHQNVMQMWRSTFTPMLGETELDAAKRTALIREHGPDYR